MSNLVQFGRHLIVFDDTIMRNLILFRSLTQYPDLLIVLNK